MLQSTETESLLLIDSNFPEAFSKQVLQTPQATAIEFEAEVWTYLELQQHANRIANFLTESCFAPGKNIGICLDRSAVAIAAMIGIMRSGSAFVPLDPEYPSDRLQYMVEDAGISVIICDDPYKSIFDGLLAKNKNLLLVEPKNRIIAEASIAPLKQEIAADSLAYIMYTSGSTGMPKGVQIEHRSMMTYCSADIDIYKLTAVDKTLQFSTLNFDIAIEEIFPPLLVGSSVVVRPRNRSVGENELLDLVNQYGITSLHLATAYWHEWVELLAASGQRIPTSLRMVLATGEKVSPTHYAKWLSLCDHDLLWCNAYGPTETTVTATVFIPGKDWQGSSMPIGKPLLGYEAYILDSQDMPLGVGQTGDLYIGGPALSRGYLNRPEKNQAAFREVTFPSGERKRLYKTGDLARWLPSGDIEFAGRIDHQLKLGSYRIEPGEIEFHLSSHPKVLDSLVVCDESSGKKVLVAYVARGCHPVSAIELMQYARDLLPIYMIPVRYCFVESFPKTINGKIDRSALPDPSTAEIAREETIDRPRNSLEELLVKIWSDVLGIPEVGIHDDFFALGGSSLLVTSVISRIRQHYEIAIPVRDFFANPTIACIASQIGQRLNREEFLFCSIADSTSQTDSAAIRSRLPVIQPHYFDSQGRDLFGVRYKPCHWAKTSQRRHAVVLCPSLGHEYPRAHRNLQQLAIQLSQTGCDVLRFDYTGCGNSAGSCDDGDVETWTEDIQSAVAHFRQISGCEQVSLLGIRMGAALAARAADGDVSQLILWDPVVKGHDWLTVLEKFHDRTLSTVGYYSRPRSTTISQRFGLVLPKAKLASLDQLDLFEALRKTQLRTLMVSSLDDDSGKLDYQNIAKASGAKLDHLNTSDEIYWNQAIYTESAFTSPQSIAAIVKFVQAESR